MKRLLLFVQSYCNSARVMMIVQCCLFACSLFTLDARLNLLLATSSTEDCRDDGMLAVFSNKKNECVQDTNIPYILYRTRRIVLY